MASMAYSTWYSRPITKLDVMTFQMLIPNSSFDSENCLKRYLQEKRWLYECHNDEPKLRQHSYLFMARLKPYENYYHYETMKIICRSINLSSNS
jgi:hypothetical protein